MRCLQDPGFKINTISEIWVHPSPGPLLLVVSVILLHPQVRDRDKWKLSRERERKGDSEKDVQRAFAHTIKVRKEYEKKDAALPSLPLRIID